MTTPKTFVRRHSSVLPEPPLLQFVLLSLLLHMLVVLLFGSTQYGGARRGDSVFGTLDVTLREISPERGSGFTLAPGVETTVPGAALLRRLEGFTSSPAMLPRRDAAPPVIAPAPPSPAPPSPAPPSPAPPTPAPTAKPVPDATISTPQPPAESLPQLDRSAPVEVDKPLATPVPTPPVVVQPAPVREIVPPVVAPPREIVLPDMAPLEKVEPAKIEQQSAPSIEFQRREMPLPAAVPIEPVAPAKIEHLPTPPVELPAPRKAPVETRAPPARVAPTSEHEAPASPAVVPRATSPAVPQTAPAVAPQAAPQAVPRSEAVESAPARERATPTSPSATAPAKLAPVPSRTDAGTGGELPRPRQGAPNVDDDVFRSRRDAPPSDTESKTGITADSLRRRASEIVREGSGSRGVLNLVPPPPPVETKDKLAEDLAKAAKPDCRTAYANMGLLAIAPLVASSVGNGGCRW